MSRLKLLSFYTKSILPKPTATVCVNSLRQGSNWVPQDTETHTGQKWDSDDYRLARYIDKSKHVNPNFAIKLIDEIPPTASKERVVCCDGGGGPLGHPKVYINLDKPGSHACGYCGLRFCLSH